MNEQMMHTQKKWNDNREWKKEDSKKSTEL